MSGCRFSFIASAKKVREKAIKCSLKTTEVLKLYQGTVDPDCFKSHTYS